MILALTVAVLVGGGVYLMLQRSMVRIVFGFALFSHGVNFILLGSGVSAWRGEPLTDRTPLDMAADPLPMAFVLTAIVITFAVTVLLLMFSVLGHNDDTHRVPSTGEEHDR